MNLNLLQAFAINSLTNIKQTDVKGQSANSVEAIITSLINTLIWAVGFVAVAMLIYGGFKYITAQGNEKNVATARSIIMYAVIGLIITAIAFAIRTFVLQRVGSS